MRNKYRVPKKQWAKWNAMARSVFNEVYGVMMGSPWAFTHPKAAKVSQAQWKATAWNAAWTAAGAVIGERIDYVVECRKGKPLRNAKPRELKLAE